jgi:diamine N-acetyltransferase
LYANISIENNASIALFTKFGFQKAGTKKDWTLVNGVYKDEVVFQLINK